MGTGIALTIIFIFACMNASLEWYRAWFDSPYYHILYKYRNDAEARAFIDALIDYLKPPRGSRMLDLACGKGRHAHYLCSKGFEVTGIDLSPANIAAARKIACRNLYFEVHDMREVLRENYFDYIFNFFTSFGYFDREEDNIRTMDAMARGLKDEGVVCIDFLNAHRVIEDLHPAEELEIDGIVFHIHRHFEEGYIIKEIDFEDGGRSYHFHEKVQALCLSDFDRLFAASGLRRTAVFGDYRLGPFREESSDRLILMAKKEKR